MYSHNEAGGESVQSWMTGTQYEYMNAYDEQGLGGIDGTKDSAEREEEGEWIDKSIGATALLLATDTSMHSKCDTVQSYRTKRQSALITNPPLNCVYRKTMTRGLFQRSAWYRE